MEAFSRTEPLLGKEGLKRLAAARVALFGVGGVGGYCAEALARSGVGAIDLVDGDVVALTNLNRQLHALHSTLGRYKAEVASERVKDINPACEVRAVCSYFLPETADAFDFSGYDYIIDAIDTVTGKVALAVRANESGVPIISAMGAGNKLDATKFEVADLFETEVCPLARVMRRELKKRGIRSLKVVYSRELPAKGLGVEHGKAIPGSVAFVPSVAGLILAGEVVKAIAKVGAET